ncbi:MULTISPECIES: metal ABC transporter substrate-binding protein [unclassified Sulfurimonas]|uniref:metal ABC transporter substrate-binding protein n=1 Tax=unclassified Sulfurimonas TaxID=2623549 RepID=UPI000A5BDA00|nr:MULTISPECIES: metal ABC transporter substrate-binding protein [unclassified Sulfurimonas]
MNFNSKIFITVITIFISFASMSAKELNKIPSVAISTFSLYDISKNIAADSAEIFMILPFGVDAHSYEPTPKEMIKISKSNLVVYSGAGLEPWIERFEFKNKMLNMSLHVKLRELGGHEGHHHAHNESGVDPHYWLDTQNMIIATQTITKEFIELLPHNKELYIKNRDSYINMLNSLDAEYKKKLSTCKLDTIIVNHDAFSYLAHRYGFEVEALSGISPEAEPSAKNMLRLIEHVKEHRVSTVFFESFVSDKAIKSIAKEAKASCEVLQPLGNITADEAKANLSYEDIMRINLQKISKALECQ